MRKFIVSILFFLIYSTGPSQASSKPFGIGVINIPPFIIMDEKQQRATGGVIYLKIKKALDEEFGRGYNGYKVMVIPFKRALVELKSGYLQGFFPFIKNKEREKFVRFTSASILKSVPGVCRLKNSPHQKKKKFSMASLDGTPIPEILTDYKNMKPFLIEGSHHLARMIHLLRRKRIQAIYYPVLHSLLWVMREKKILPLFECMALPGKPFDLRFAVTKKYPLEKFKKIDKAISKVLTAPDYIKEIKKPMDELSRLMIKRKSLDEFLLF